ncbi:MAG TPA: large conductance mechanosensitive channel protein MscL [Nocardioidaceae bacterium]|nr:large conductance mechanosensitive channel protein MscL [Nocardioidaceae bacterium]
MLKGFRDFLVRGNLIELAVAFVIGLAFATVVTSFVDNILMPIIGKFGGRPDFSAIDVFDIPIGAFINDLVSFVLIAAAVYFIVVVPYNRIRELRKKEEPEEAEQLEETVLLLREIRDALVRSGSGGTTT